MATKAVKFKKGDRVRVKGYRPIAVIAYKMKDVKGGVVLSRFIGGFQCWNVADLVKVKEAHANRD